MADTPTSVTQYQTGFAPELAPYGQALLGQTAALTNVNTNPYQQYQGDMTAQFTPLQQQSYQNAALMQTAPQLQDASALAGMAGLGALNTQYTFKPSDFGSAYSSATTRDAQGNVTGNSMMNPYTDVMDAQARKNAAIAQQQQQAQAATSGAFGGSGDYIMRGQNNANLQSQLAQNQYNAYNQAMQQYNTQNQLNAQQQQYGAGLGMQGLQAANQAASTLGNLGNQQYNQNVGLIGLQNQLGGQQQQQTQNVLNTQYQNYLNAQNYPYQQLNFMSNIIRGLPMNQQSASVYQAPPSMLSQVAGVGLTAAGLGAFKAAKGGAIKESHGLADLALAKMGA
jgi:hypothetical protein